MSALEQFGLALLRRMDPETAHGLALKALIDQMREQVQNVE